MITLPISLAELIIGVLLLGPILCVVTVITTQRAYSKWERNQMDKRELAMHEALEQLEEQKEALAERELKANGQEYELRAQRLDLVRQAHDVGAVAQLEAHLLEDQTEVQVMDWKELDDETPSQDRG